MSVAQVAPAVRPWRIRPVPVRTPPALDLPAPGAVGWSSTDYDRSPHPLQQELDLDLSATQLPLPERDQPHLDSNGLLLPDAEIFTAHIAVTLIEVMYGRRPLGHVGRVTTNPVRASVERRRRAASLSALARSPQRPAQVRRVIGGAPRPGRYEAAVVLDDGSRARAMALSLESHDGRWLVTDLRLG